MDARTGNASTCVRRNVGAMSLNKPGRVNEARVRTYPTLAPTFEMSAIPVGPTLHWSATSGKTVCSPSISADVPSSEGVGRRHEAPSVADVERSKDGAEPAREARVARVESDGASDVDHRADARRLR